MLVFIRTMVQTKAVKASFFTILAVIPSLHTKPVGSVPLTPGGVILVTLGTPKEKIRENDILCCSKTNEHSVIHHDDCLENHRRSNRRQLNRRRKTSCAVDAHRRIFDTRRSLDTGMDRRGAKKVNNHYCHSKMEH